MVAVIVLLLSRRDCHTAVRAGELRAEWKQKRTPVCYSDGFLAATALTMGFVMVTRNVRHFDHISGLVIENWFE
jgi:tRNA(fMet)-specific endonuclease VapC